MKLWCTEFKAICARTGELKEYVGENVPGLNMTDAQNWCYENRGYLTVVGELVAEIPCKEGTYKPDWDKKMDYENIQNN